MKCEMCHKAEAETAIRKEADGETHELYVCHGCAVKEATTPQQDAPQSAAPGRPLGAEALPLMGMILDAAFEIVGRAMNLAEPSCPACGIQRQEYRKQSRLGCPACYEAFSKELDAAVFELHRASQHVGKVPQRAKALGQRRQLAEKLEAAVKEQRYEEAIALRDALHRLDGSEQEKGDGA